MPDIFLTGGAWITAAGRGSLSGGEAVPWPPPPGLPAIPPAREIFSERVPRYGRYDDLTKLGCACVGLALRDAGWANRSGVPPSGAAEIPPEGGTPQQSGPQNATSGGSGLLTSSRLECLETDIAYYATARGEGGTLASPNLFSYTLPGIMAGECAVNFKLAGPTLCVGEAGGIGMAALRQAVLLLVSGAAPAMVAGWIDWFADEQEAARLAPGFISGAAFVVLETTESAGSRARRQLPEDLQGITSIFDLFNKT